MWRRRTHPLTRALAGLMSVALVIVQLSFPQRAEALGTSTASAGSVPPPTATSVQSFQPDLFTGRASTAIPLAVPPGRHGMQPTLALSYASSSRNSWVGVGWGFDLGYIERSTKDGAPHYDNTDTYTFMFQGVMSELVRIPDGTYRAKDEGLFLRFAPLGSGWEIRDKSGTRYLFGQTIDSQIAEGVRIFRWALEQVIDTNGNSLSIAYTKDQNQLYPSQIRYTAHEPTGLAPANQVDFILDTTARPDVEVSYRSGFAVATAKRLKFVEANTTMVGQMVLARRYQLEYLASPLTNRTLLMAVTTIGYDGAKLPPVTFAYQSTPTSYVLKRVGSGSAQPQVAWNVRKANHDFRHDNFNCGEAPTNPYAGLNWSTPTVVSGTRDLGCVTATANSDGSFSVSGCRDHYMHAWTFLYVNTPKTISLSGGGFCAWTETSSGVALINNWNSVSLPAGWSFLHLTAHHEHDSFSASQSASLIAQVDLVQPTPSLQFGEPQLAADFNGDGISDIATFTQTPTPGTWKVTPAATFDGFKLENTWLSSFGDGASSPVVGDWNEDGRTDVAIFNPTTGAWRFAMSDGTKLVDQPSWALTFGAGGSPLSGDVNGDAQVDLGRYANGVWQFAVNNGNGFTPTDALNITWGSSSYEALTGDFNGDGLTDLGLLNLSGSTVEVRLSTGTGWTAAQTWLSGIDPSQPHTTADVNGDGLTDVAFYNKLSGQWTSYPAMGTGFGSGKALPVTFGIRESLVGLQVADVNGDGLIDPAVFSRTSTLTEMAFSQGGIPDALTTMNNGLGGSTTITYQLSPELDAAGGEASLRPLPFVLPVVTQVDVNDGFGNTYTTRYVYHGGRYDPASKEFRGFAQVQVLDAENTAVTTDFLQDERLKGRIKHQVTTDQYGKRYTEAENTWECAEPFTDVHVCLVKRAISRTFDGDFTAKEVASTFIYDAYGNVTKALEEGEPLRGGDERFTVTQYALNPTMWMLNRVSQATVYAGSDERAPIASQRRFFYDYAASPSTAPSVGNLTKEDEWLSEPGAQSPERWLPTTMTFDPYGNVKTVTDALNHTVTNTYDPTGTYLIRIKNHLGHTRSMIYDPRSGQVTSATDQNAITTQTQYDAFGRVTKIIGPNDSEALPTISYEYDLSVKPIKTTTHTRLQSGQAATLDVYAFTDGLGRTIQTRSPAEDPTKQIVTGLVTFNARGLVVKQWAPFVAPFSTSMTLAPPGTAAATYQYDAIGRQTFAFAPDGAMSATAYNDWAVTVIDPLGHKTRRTSDAFGRLITVEEFNGPETYATTYEYDTLNRLTRVVDTKGNITKIVYDSLGRKLSMDDPDMGHWGYAYDDVDNLISQTDARGVVTSFTYDELNRLKQKSYTIPSTLDLPPSTSVSYTYDDPLKLFSKGKLTGITDGSGSSSFEHDNLGRLVKESKTIDGTTYTIQRSYDLLGRLVTVSNPKNDRVAYTYNLQGGIETVDLTPATGPLSHVVTDVQYNAAGQILKLAYGNGLVSDYSYDPKTLRLSTLSTYPAALPTNTLQDFSYQFDRVGNVLGITDKVHTGTQAFEYDALDRLTRAIGVSYGDVRYAYDPIGNMLSKEGVAMTYGLPDGSKPHAVTGVGSGFGVGGSGLELTYDENGNMLTKGAAAYAYDAENRLVQVDNQADGSQISVTYDFKPGWNLFAIPIQLQDWRADAVVGALQGCAVQLSRYNSTSGKFEHFVGNSDYDQFTTLEYLRGYELYVTKPGGCTLTLTGTKPTTQPQVNLQNGWSLIGVPVQQPTPVADALAPLTASVDYSQVTAYDTSTGTFSSALSQLTPGQGVFLKALGAKTWVVPALYVQPKQTTRFVYDGDGGRVKQITAAGTTTFLGQSYEIGPDGKTTAYIFAGSQRIAAKDSTGALRFYHGDHLGSSNLITDATGAVVELAEYSPYGSLSRREGTANVPQKFTGQRLDVSTGLYFNNARYYDAQLGRFTQADTIVQAPGDPQSLNRYSYVRNNPVRYIDPSGNSWKTFWSSLLGAFVGGVVAGLILVATGGALAPLAFGIGGAVGGAITGGLTGGWQGALVGAGAGALLGTGAGVWGAPFAIGATAVFGAYSAATGGWEGLGDFASGLAGGIVGGSAGYATGTGVGNALKSSAMPSLASERGGIEVGPQKISSQLEVNNKPEISSDGIRITQEAIGKGGMPKRIAGNFYGQKYTKYVVEEDLRIFYRMHISKEGVSGPWKPVTDQQIISKIQGMIDLGIKPEWGDYKFVSTYGIPKGEVAYKGGISYQGEFALGGADQNQYYFRYLKKAWLIRTDNLQ